MVSIISEIAEKPALTRDELLAAKREMAAKATEDPFKAIVDGRFDVAAFLAAERKDTPSANAEPKSFVDRLGLKDPAASRDISPDGIDAEPKGQGWAKAVTGGGEGE